MSNKKGASAKVSVLAYMAEHPEATWKQFEADMPGKASRRSFRRYKNLPIKHVGTVVATPAPVKKEKPKKAPYGSKMKKAMVYIANHPGITYSEFYKTSGMRYSENTFYRAQDRLINSTTLDNPPRKKKVDIKHVFSDSFVKPAIQRKTELNLSLLVKLFLLSSIDDSYGAFKEACPKVDISEALFYTIRKKMAA